MPKYKVLIADYEPRSIKKTQEILLNNFDCETEVAQNGIVALERFNQTKPDLVLLEAMIPKKHGFEVCLEMKNSSHGKNIPVVITTHVYKGVKYRNQALHIYKCDDYIEKPCTDEFITETIRKFIPISEEKAARSKKIDEAKESVLSEKGKPIPAEKAKMGIPEDIEREIASKVDEVLTLFAGEELFAPSEKKESEKEKKTTARQESKPKPAVKKDLTVPVEQQKQSEMRVSSVEEAAPPQKAEQPPDLAKVYEQPVLETPAEVKQIPEEILPVPPVRYKSVNFKMAVIGISALVFLGILIVVFPLFKGKGSEDKIVKPVVQADVQKPASKAVSVTPPQIPSTDKKVQQSAGIGQPPALSAGGEASKSLALDQGIQQPAKKELPTAKTADQPPPKAAPKASVLPAVVENKQQRLFSENTTPPDQSASAAKPQEAAAVQTMAKTPQPDAADSQKNEPPVSSGTVSRTDQAASSPAGDGEVEEIPPAKPILTPEPQKAPADAAQQEAPPIIKINEGDLVEYSQLDREPGFLAHEMPKYPVVAKLRNVEGNVILKVLIGTNGHVQDVKLMKGLESSLDELSVSAARQWVYRPPTKNGIRVQTWKTETVTFSEKSSK